MGEPRSTTPKPRDERSQPTFSYPGLDSSKNEIRLVILQPRGPSDEIICELLLANLDDEPNFEALSYEWGSSKSTMLPIQINGQAIMIRENLWWALYYLRFEDGPRFLWIDAICINQANNKERNDQVAQMGQIYSRASRTVAWIGREETDESESQKGHVADAIECLKKLQNGNLFQSFPDVPSTTLMALSDLCSRRYWKRLWIVQELVLPPDVLVQCGSITFDFALFQPPRISRILIRLFFDKAKPELANVFFSPCNYASKIKLLRNDWTSIFKLLSKWAGYNRNSLIEIMQSTSHTECEDVRDKVFGVLSLTAKCCQDAVPPDYSKTVVEICEELLTHLHAEHQASNGSHSTQTTVETFFRPNPGAEDKLKEIPTPKLLLTESKRPKLIKMDVTLAGQIVWFYCPPKPVTTYA